MTDRKSPITFLSAMDIFEPFRQQVERYLEATGMDPTTFGVKALKDPNFVFQLRTGRCPRAKTLEKVSAFMAANPPAEPPLQEAS